MTRSGEGLGVRWPRKRVQLPLIGAIAGFGFIAERGHLPAYLAAPERFTIVAVADICEARREIPTALTHHVLEFRRWRV